ncbi:acetyl-CoA synthetase-like protein [Apiospora arundinis]|uniref:Acetyl-CoA synthetase-like protein n=1 Tax=Apiospora arundinis TaxID=335852 RepID=A0ABR2HKZ6_9PEZI
MVVVSTPVSEGSGGPCPTEPPIWSRLETSAKRFGERLAVASLDQPRGLYGFDNLEPADSSAYHLRWSYNTLSAAVDQFAQGLCNRGVGRGDLVVTYLLNRVEFIICLWAAHKLSCPFVPLHPDSLLNQDEAVHVLRLVKPKVVVTEDDVTAERFDAISHQVPTVPARVSIGASNDIPHWASLQELLEEKLIAEADTFQTRNETILPDTPEPLDTILFTSGTTSRPKGAPHISKSLNAFCQNLSLGGRSESNVFCAVLPNNHAAGYFFTLHFMMNGGALVYASARFQPERILEAMEAETVTHIKLVPTTLHRFAEALRQRSTLPALYLRDVCLAGAFITPQHLQFVVDSLGSTNVSTGFGMTEGSPVWSAPGAPEKFLHDGKIVVSGPISPGASVKICAPDSSDPLPLGQVGELHQSGPGLVRGYLASGENTGTDSPFYEDGAGRLWFATGDQGKMLEDGRVVITGRYKEIINRGGFKISPGAMEAVIQRLCSETVQVVGVSDELAGQVPIVVCENTVKSSAEEIRTAIVREMGTKYSPVEILLLRDLNINDYPRTSSGKIQKGVLSAHCLTYVQDQERRSEQSRVSSLEMGLLQAYKKATGMAIADIDKTVPTTSFADSITLMRVRDSLRKSMGVDLSVRDMADHPTIESQVLLLEQRKAGAHNIRKHTEAFSPASLASMCDSVEKGQKLASAVSDVVTQQGFQWPGDVTAVIPLHDYMQVLIDTQIIDTWNFAIAVQTTNSSVEELEKALCAALANNPVLTSIYAESEEKRGFFITLAPTDVLWDKCISIGSPLKKRADLEQFAVDYPHRHHARVPGPLFHAVLMQLEETGSAAMVFYIHHLVHDASSQRLFFADLDMALEQPTQPLAAHRDYRAWAQSYQALRNSPLASLSVEYHVQRLQSMHEHRAALYPPAHVPRRAIEESPDGLDHQFDAPGLLDLKRRLPGIDASTVLKTAMAIVNVSRTGHTHALFNNFEAGRGAFPFVPDSLAAAVGPPSALDAADVNGPTMEGACNLHAVPRHERALALLARVHADQALLTQHCHAPLRRILDGLDAADAETMLDVHRAQLLTWVPGFLGDYERLAVARLAIRCDPGLVIVGGIAGPRATTFACTLRWDVANYSRAEAGRFIEDVGVVVGRLTSAAHWEEEVGVFVDLVKSGDSAVSGSLSSAGYVPESRHPLSI